MVKTTPKLIAKLRKIWKGEWKSATDQEIMTLFFNYALHTPDVVLKARKSAVAYIENEGITNMEGLREILANRSELAARRL